MTGPVNASRTGVRNVVSILTALLLAVLAPAVPRAAAQTKPAVAALPGGPPASAIFIGNSFFYYNSGIHNQVLNLIYLLLNLMVILPLSSSIQVNLQLLNLCYRQ